MSNLQIALAQKVHQEEDVTQSNQESEYLENVKICDDDWEVPVEIQVLVH